MRLFYEVVLRSLRRQLTYRAAALAGLTTNFFFGLLRAAVLIALTGGAVTAGLSSQDILTYTALTQALIVLLGIFGWYDLMNTVHRGEVATDLLRPMDFFSFWLAQDLGRAVAAFLLRGLTIMVAFALVFDLHFPQGVAQWAAVGVSLLLAWLLSFAFRFLVNLMAFWSPDARGIGRFCFMAVMFLSGFLMPLRLFPEWVQQIAHLTPFPHLLDTVVMVYLGKLQGAALLQALAAQAAWAGVLTLAGQLVLARATRRLVLQGG